MQKRWDGQSNCSGVAKNTPDGMKRGYTPCSLIAAILGTVNDSYNAVFVQGRCYSGRDVLWKRGGELPTASAVVGDVFDVVKEAFFIICCGKDRMYLL